METRKKETQKPYALIGDELLVAIFKEFPKREPLGFEEDIMFILYAASKNSEYAQLFENYAFDVDGAFPYSKAISEGFYVMEVSRMLNINHLDFWVSGAVERRFEDFIRPKLNEKQIELLQKLTRKIKRKLRQIA